MRSIRWTDERGDVHYTDDYTKVPERYRSSIKKIEDEKETEPAKKVKRWSLKEQRKSFKGPFGERRRVLEGPGGRVEKQGQGIAG